VTVRQRFHAAETIQKHARNGRAPRLFMNVTLTGGGRYMAMWRIRINLADDPRSRARLDEVLATQRVQVVQLTPRPGVTAELSGDVVLELPRDDALGEMLTALHTISPQVFVSRADADEAGLTTADEAELAAADSAVLTSS
jgi:hypothetical protein